MDDWNEEVEEAMAAEAKNEEPASVTENEHSDDRGESLPETENVTPAKKSVKYLTCWYWQNRGSCKKTEDECLYSHRDTGHYADRPRPANAGGPSVAGRNAKQYRGNHQGHNRNNNWYYRGTSNVLGANYNYAQPPMERLNIDPSPPAADASIMDQSIPTTIPGPHDRRMTVGANRPVSSHGETAVGPTTPVLLTRANEQAFGFVPQGAPAHKQVMASPSPKAGSRAISAGSGSGNDSLFSSVQTTRIARKLDSVLCEVLKGLVNVSEDLLSVSGGGGEGAAVDASVVTNAQARIKELFVVGKQGHDEAEDMAKKGFVFGQIFDGKAFE